MQNLIGQSIGRYHIIEKLGEGGMANVYKAYDTQLERDVAVKVIRVDSFPSTAIERVMKRFEREAKSQARISHPNIVKVYDFGIYNGDPFLVMEYLSGGTLKDLMGKPVQWKTAIGIVIPIAQALNYAHKMGVLHRDVKPANIMLTADGQPMLSDFGIAKLLDDKSGHTLTGIGVGVGTPEYMAPEQGLGKELDGRADVYSLGVLLYELVTGRTPFQADTPLAVLLKQVNDPLPRPAVFVSEIPEQVEQIIFKALAKDPVDRYSDMSMFVLALQKLILIEPVVINQSITVQNKTDKPANMATVIKTHEYLTIRSRRIKSNWWKWSLGLGGILLVSLMGNPIIKGLESIQKQIIENNKIIPTTKPSTISIAQNNTPIPSMTLTPTLGVGSIKVREKDGMEMVYVPSGEFSMGSNDGDSDEKPVHNVFLDNYWIDKTEITNYEYQTCVQAGFCQESKYKNEMFFNKSYQPVVGIGWNQAQKYCQWVGARLPSEAEWEKAARGTDGRKYPWGNQDPSSTVLNQVENGATYAEYVGGFLSGASPYGALDMAGNVWEWVNDWYDESYYSQSPNSNPDGPSSGIYKGMRGGSFVDINNIRSSNRNGYYPSTTSSSYGFRCASSEFTEEKDTSETKTSVTQIQIQTITPTIAPTITPTITPTVIVNVDGSPDEWEFVKPIMVLKTPEGKKESSSFKSIKSVQTKDQLFLLLEFFGDNNLSNSWLELYLDTNPENSGIHHSVADVGLNLQPGNTWAFFTEKRQKMLTYYAYKQSHSWIEVKLSLNELEVEKGYPIRLLFVNIWNKKVEELYKGEGGDPQNVH